jgi:hypothetical protein
MGTDVVEMATDRIGVEGDEDYISKGLGDETELGIGVGPRTEWFTVNDHVIFHNE